MADVNVRAIIQARMSSARFPGKVLAPVRGKPLVDHVIDRVQRAIPVERIVIATSDQASDDPLAAHVAARGIAVFRGSLDDVFQRFRRCLQAFPCDWFFRICADSPLYNQQLLRSFLSQIRDDVDLVTNVFPRTFPKGHSVELLRTERFALLDPGELDASEKEHVTKCYYNHPDRFTIINVESGNPDLSSLNYCIDTLDDLRRIEVCLTGENV
jgi:spore coat polysaccharide biosynthesis protein SpsF